MTKIIAITFVVILQVAVICAVYASSDVSVIQCGTIVDASLEEPLSEVSLLVRDGTIVAIGNDFVVPQGAKIIDLSGAYCLPGFIDMHVHLMYDPTVPLETTLSQSSAQKVLTGMRNAQTMLNNGFTTLRIAGDLDKENGIINLRDAIARKEIMGPRLVVAAHGISAESADFGTVTGVTSMRSAVRKEIRLGSDWIKLYGSGSIMSARENPDTQTLTNAEIQVAVEEAHRHGKKVAVHAHSSAAVIASARAGADTIEHGTLMTDAAIQAMRDSDTTYIPTLYALDHLVNGGITDAIPKSFYDKAVAADARHDENFQKVLKSGVNIALGSDTVFPHELAAREFGAMVGLGMDSMAAIAAGTIVAARVLGLSDITGSIEVGKKADIVAVLDNPIENIQTLEEVIFVMRSGKVIKHKKPPSSAALH